ncbi:hypothetical protein LINPERPRIM_LOCUS8290 [Linum perenne]
MASNPSLKPEIGPYGLARESPVIAYTERVRNPYPSLLVLCFVFVITVRISVMKFYSSGICVFFLFLQAQESSNLQFARLVELKRRIEALNPNRASSTNISS